MVVASDMEETGRTGAECRCLRRAVQVLLGVAVVALAMVNGGLLTSYFSGNSGDGIGLRYARQVGSMAAGSHHTISVGQ
ncbi:hypothetical protein MTO96_031110 [Rhipicephalus appendiculatus]